MAMTVYVALLRGINVGGNRKVEMSRLKEIFEGVGTNNVRTYINSGNVIFTDERRPGDLDAVLEKAIEEEFGFHVEVLLRDLDAMRSLVDAIPSEWVNDKTQRTDVWFLWDDHDTPEVMDGLTIKDGIDEVFYVPGAVVWCADGEKLTRSGRGRVIGTKLYKSLTARNVNSVRKIHSLMEELAG